LGEYPRGRVVGLLYAARGSGGLAGDVWTAGTFTSNQYSQIEVTSKQLLTGQWIGAAVRVQHHGLDAYVGIDSWANGRAIWSFGGL
jgi:hypothetical protein